jgi:PleD family two-component response regulator
MAHDGLVYQSSSSTAAEAVIQRTIEGIQMLMDPQYNNNNNNNNSQRLRDKEEEGQSSVASSSVIEINPVAKRHWELQIEILQDSPRDADKLKAILKVKGKEYEKATDSEEIERLVTGIEMLKFVLFLVM